MSGEDRDDGLYRPRVFVADRVLPAVMAKVREQFDLVYSEEAAPDGILATLNVQVDSAFFERAGSQLKIVANYGVGVDNIDLDAAQARGVIVTNTPDVLTAATAEHALALMLSLLRRVAEGDRMLRAERPWEFALDFMLGESLQGKRLGIVGPGRIGHATAVLAKALGAEALFIGRGGSITTQVGSLDILSLHCPLTAETRHLIDAEVFAAMPSSAVLVNTARGPIVDESALVDALETGGINGAALDVFEFEPKVSARLLKLENVVLTPHLGSGTLQAREAMGLLAVRSLATLLLERRVPPAHVTVGMDSSG